jgi:hypothetical protein
VLRQRNDDLKLAYEQAREADRMKDAVILNMSDRMEQSVKAIHATVGEFRQNIAEMDAVECRHMTEKIRTHTETTTELLGNLLNIADRKDTFKQEQSQKQAGDRRSGMGECSSEISFNSAEHEQTRQNSQQEECQ